MLRDFFALALGNLKHRGLRSWLTMLGIFIGIAAVVSLISLGQGLQEAITGQFASLSTDTLLIQNTGTAFGPPGSTSVTKLTKHDMNIIENIDGIKLVIPRILRVAKIEYNKVSTFEFVGSIPKADEGVDFIYRSFNLEVQEGRLLKTDDRGKVLLGSDYKTTERFDKDVRIGSNIQIQGRNFEVIGFLKETSNFQFNSAILMPEDDVVDLFNIDNEIDFIVVQVENPDRSEEVANQIIRKLRDDRNQKIGEEDFSVQTPIQSLQAVNTILIIINIVVVGIAAISLFVGAIGIANTMYTSVLERSKEIGIMKSIGARNRDILLIFLIESGLLGLVGGIVGAILGISLAFIASNAASAALGFDILKVKISYTLLFASVLLSFLIGALSGTAPAIQASRLKPVEALRK